MSFSLRPLRLIALACVMSFATVGVAYSQDDDEEAPSPVDRGVRR